MEYSFYEVLWFYLIYSFAGWCAESQRGSHSTKEICQPWICQHAAVSHLRGRSGAVRYFSSGTKRTSLYVFGGICSGISDGVFYRNYSIKSLAEMVGLFQ